MACANENSGIDPFKRSPKRGVSVGALVFGLVGLLAIVNAASVAATPATGLTSVVLGRGTDQSVGSLKLKQGTDIVMAQITVIPGGSSGWHSHPGGAIVLIKQGKLTRYRSSLEDTSGDENDASNGSQCEITLFSAGQAFLELPGEVDQVVNTGTIPYVLVSPSRACLSAVRQGSISQTRESAQVSELLDVKRGASFGGGRRALRHPSTAILKEWNSASVWSPSA